MSPGLVATDLLREHWWFAASWLHPLWAKVLMSTDEAAARVVRIATSDALVGITGQCFAATLRPISLPFAAKNVSARGALWDLSAKLTSGDRR